MLKFFNSIQLVALFGTLPYIMTWLKGQPFEYANMAFYTAAVVYLILGIVLTSCVYYTAEAEKL